MAEDPVVMSLVSSRGGVGKTTLAVNVAIELAQVGKVILVDCDISGKGATLWLQSGSERGASLTVSDFVAALDANGVNATTATATLSKFTLARPRDVRSDYAQISPGELGFLPCTNEPRAEFANTTSGFWNAASRLLVAQLSERYAPDFIIFDCPPGVGAVSTSCCSISNVALCVIPYSLADMREAVLTILKIRNELNGAAWRLVINKLPSGSLYKKAEDLLRTAEEYAAQMAVSSGISTVALSNQLSMAIPDLEEFRDYERVDDVPPLSKLRRGGNCFVLCTRLLLMGLQCDRLLGRRGAELPYAREKAEVLLLRDSVFERYLDRIGFGTAGLPRWWALYSFAYAFVSSVYLCTLLAVETGTIKNSGGFVTLSLQLGELLIFFGALGAAVICLGAARRALGAMAIFAQFYSQQPKPDMQLNRLYNDGGNRATTSNFWWPRIVWGLGFVAPGLLVLAKWAMVDHLYTVRFVSLEVRLAFGGGVAVALGVVAFTKFVLRRSVLGTLRRTGGLALSSLSSRFYR